MSELEIYSIVMEELNYEAVDPYDSGVGQRYLTESDFATVARRSAKEIAARIQENDPPPANTESAIRKWVRHYGRWCKYSYKAGSKWKTDGVGVINGHFIATLESRRIRNIRLIPNPIEAAEKEVPCTDK